MLSQILHWAEKQTGIRSILMVGSRANNGKQDNLSDYDLSIFGNQFDFIAQDDWLNGISAQTICIHEKFYWGDWQIPTRLVLFENHAKVDFSFHPLSLLENMVSTKKLNQTYDAGYQVLLDKDGITGQLPKPSFQAYRIARPTEHEFENCQNEFWFESYHVAKYIMRFDLWAAKIRDHDMKKWLLAMLEWNAATRSNFTLSIKREGKYISDWIHPAYKSRMGACFAGWDALAQHSALMASLDLFRTVAKETASLLDYAYKEKPDQNLSNYIATLIPYTDGQSPL